MSRASRIGRSAEKQTLSLYALFRDRVSNRAHCLSLAHIKTMCRGKREKEKNKIDAHFITHFYPTTFLNFGGVWMDDDDDWLKTDILKQQFYFDDEDRRKTKL